MATVDIGNAFQRQLYLENPIAGDRSPAFWTDEAIFVLQLRGVIHKFAGTFPTAEWAVRYDVDRDDVGILVASSLFGGSTSFGNVRIANSLIPAGRWVWLDFIEGSLGVDRPRGFSLQLLGRSRDL